MQWLEPTCNRAGMSRDIRSFPTYCEGQVSNDIGSLRCRLWVLEGNIVVGKPLFYKNDTGTITRKCNSPHSVTDMYRHQRHSHSVTDICICEGGSTRELVLPCLGYRRVPRPCHQRRYIQMRCSLGCWARREVCGEVKGFSNVCSET